MSRVPSPCNRVCALNADNVCLGCKRTLAEIEAWAVVGDVERRAILEAARLRILRPDA